MLKFKSPVMTAPPGGWRFEDPDSGYVYRRPYRTLSYLINHIEAYREANSLEPIENLEEVVIDWLCRQPGCEGLCVSVVKRSVGQYVSGAKGLAKTVAKNVANKVGLSEEDGFCGRAEAERRAKICENCPKNVFDEVDSLARNYTNAFARSVVGNRRVSNAGSLKTCEVCTCPLATKVWLDRETVESEVEDGMDFPEGMPGKDGTPFTCWQLFKD